VTLARVSLSPEEGMALLLRWAERRDCSPGAEERAKAEQRAERAPPVRDLPELYAMLLAEEAGAVASGPRQGDLFG